jgi:hypothetical protein
LRCEACGSVFHLAYHTLVFIVLWVFLSPVYLLALLFLLMSIAPRDAVMPLFFMLFFASALLLPFFGHARLKRGPPGP